MLGFICFFYFYNLYIVNVVSKNVFIILIEKMLNQKRWIKTKKVIGRAKRIKTLSKAKPVKNPKSSLEISPVQNELLSSRKLRDHTYE